MCARGTIERGQDLRRDRRPTRRADSAADLAEKMIVSRGAWLRLVGFEMGGELLIGGFEPGVRERSQPRHQQVEQC